MQTLEQQIINFLKTNEKVQFSFIILKFGDQYFKDILNVIDILKSKNIISEIKTSSGFDSYYKYEKKGLRNLKIWPKY